MRVLVIVFILLVSLTAVFVETAVMAAWGDMSFSQGETRPWPREVKNSWPKKPSYVECCGSMWMAGEWYGGYGADSDGARQMAVFRLAHMRLGWPIRTFTFERTLEFTGGGTIGWMMDEPDSVWSGGLAIPVWLLNSDDSVDVAMFRRIPLRPLWGGMLVAVAMHAVPMGAAWYGVAWAARWRRRRRERCERCGYDVRGLAVCPECARPKGGG